MLSKEKRKNYNALESTTIWFNLGPLVFKRLQQNMKIFMKPSFLSNDISNIGQGE